MLLSSYVDMPQVTSVQDVGALIRERRRELTMSQAALAARIGVSRQWIVEVERGKERAEVGLVLRALNALGLAARVERRPADAVDLDVLLARARGEEP